MADEVKITGTASVPGWRTYDVDLRVELPLRDLYFAAAIAGVAARGRYHNYDQLVNEANEITDAALKAGGNDNTDG